MFFPICRDFFEFGEEFFAGLEGFNCEFVGLFVMTKNHSFGFELFASADRNGYLAAI